MRSLTIVVVVAVIASVSGSAAAQSTAPVLPPAAEKTPSAERTGLAGTWDAIARSSGGIGSTMLFSEDGSFALILGAMVEMKYRVSGNKLTFYGEESGRNFSDTQGVGFRGDTAILSGNGCRIRLIPLEPRPPQGSLIGQWRFTHMTGVQAYEDFSADGRGRLRVPLQVQKGSYSVGDNAIAFYALTPRPSDWTSQFTLQNDTLTISNDLGQHRYVRAAPLIPMAVEQPLPPKKLLC
jgi:hypothetical protein